MNLDLIPTATIVQRKAFTIVGLSISTSVSANETAKLWADFGPLRKTISHQSDAGSYSIQSYDRSLLAQPFLPTTKFEYWAGVAVSQIDDLVPPLQVKEMPAATWAVFTYQGMAKDFGTFVAAVMQNWLPRSGYELLDLPQFQYMDKNYLGPNHPKAKEAFWIPIKEK